MDAFDLEIEKYVKKLGSRLYRCLKCGYEATSKAVLKTHVECNHFVTPGFPCHKCGFVSKTRPSLKLHIFRRHRHEPSFFDPNY